MIYLLPSVCFSPPAHLDGWQPHSERNHSQVSPLFQKTGHIPARLPHPCRSPGTPHGQPGRDRQGWVSLGFQRGPPVHARPQDGKALAFLILRARSPRTRLFLGRTRPMAGKGNKPPRHGRRLPLAPHGLRSPRQPGSLCPCRPHGMRTPCGSQAGRVCVLFAILRRDKLAAAAKVRKLLSRGTRHPVPSPLEPAAIMKGRREISATSGLCKVQHRPARDLISPETVRKQKAPRSPVPPAGFRVLGSLCLSPSSTQDGE